MRAASLLMAGLTLGATLGVTGQNSTPTLTGTSDFTSDPEGARIGILLAGAPVRVLETRGEWARIGVEGWIRTEDLPAGALPPEAPPAPGAPAAPAAAQAGPASLSGAIFVSLKDGTTAAGALTTVRILPRDSQAPSALEAARRDCAQRRGLLEQRAADLKLEADRAMQTIENTTRAFEAVDEARRKRRRTLGEIRDLDEQCARDLDAILDRHAAAATLSGNDGRFRFEEIAPGAYLLHARFDAKGTRHEWEVPVDVGAGGSVTLDLTHLNRTREAPLPGYR